MEHESSQDRIAYIAGEYPAGSHTFILREVEALRELGHDIETCSIREVASQNLGPAEQQAAAETFFVLKVAKRPRQLLGAQIWALKSPARYFATLREAIRLRSPGLKAFAYQLIYFLEATVLAQHLNEKKVTHIHSHFANASCTVALLAARLQGIKFSFTLHGPSDLFEAERWRLGDKVAQSDFVSCISHFARSQAMLNSAPDHWGKLHIIHCGVFPENYSGTVNADGPLQLVFVGRIAAVKGLRVLIDALSRIDADKTDYRLTIVGDGDDRAHLEKAAAHLGDRVHFAGYQSQEAVAQLLSDADALVLPSFAEGVPVVLMEAMASERPVIATRVAGVAELVEDGVSGFVVAPGDAAALAGRIETLAADPDLRARMGAAGRATVVKDFDIREEAARLSDLFKGNRSADPRPERN